MSAVTDAVDVSLTGLLASIVPLQAEYFATHDEEFFQALPTTAEIPRDGEPVTPNNLDAVPARQDASVADLMPQLTAMQLYSRGQIHRLGSGESARYVIIAEVIETAEPADIRWLRRITCNLAGPIHDTGWLQVPAAS